MLKFVLRIQVALLLCGIASAQTSQPTSALPSRHLIDSVPYTHQMPNYCGPASLCSLLGYWNIKQDQKTIAKDVFDTRTCSTNGSDLLAYCREAGLSAYSFNGSMTQLKRMISGGYPVLVIQEMSRTWREGHFRVAVGYNDTKRTITLRDGVRSTYIILSYSEFDHLWATRGRWALVAMPRDKDIFTDSLGRRNPVLHMDLAQAYLRKGDYVAAEDESLKALEIEPGNAYAKKLLAQARSPGR